MWRTRLTRCHVSDRHAMDWNYWREMKIAGRRFFEFLYRKIYLSVGLILFPFQPKKIMLFSTCPL